MRFWVPKQNPLPASIAGDNQGSTEPQAAGREADMDLDDDLNQPPLPGDLKRGKRYAKGAKKNKTSGSSPSPLKSGGKRRAEKGSTSNAALPSHAKKKPQKHRARKPEREHSLDANAPREPEVIPSEEVSDVEERGRPCRKGGRGNGGRPRRSSGRKKPLTRKRWK
ncbi:MAG: hypothetical protein LQ338_006432 [Usnochroma carphineum]|nr:MAG: hypothetical protein LQ338_006432 [Usnochroma carphineum]